LRALFDAAGFTNIRVETAARTVRFASAAEYVRVQFAATPLAGLLADRGPATRERLVALVSADVAARLPRHMQQSGLAFPQEVHIALAMA
jgi:predicted NAD/FAD-binding protein